MYKKLFFSATTIVSVIALGVGATYALFTSNTATISSSSLTSGTAEIKICNESGDGTWGGNVSPSLSLSGLVPGAAEQELTTGAQIWLGNDDGQLNTEIGSGICDAYNPNTPGSSDVAMKMVPTIPTPTCSDGTIADKLMVKFDINGNTLGPAKLSDWDTNATPVNLVFSPGGAAQVKVFASLDSSSDAQNANCTFDINFNGKQEAI